jgi:hypothetical protein
VIVFPPPANQTCDPPARPIFHPVYHHGIYRVVILYGQVASGGQGALSYDSVGVDCGHSYGAAVSSTEAGVAVPWQQTGPIGATVTLRYQAPSCATYESDGAAPGTMAGQYYVSLYVAVPLDRVHCGSVTSHTVQVRVGTAKDPATSITQSRTDMTLPTPVLGTLSTTRSS